MYCNSCNGVGTIVCADCNGRGRVVRYIELQSEFENYQLVDIIAHGGLTKEYLNLLTGKLIYQYVEGDEWEMIVWILIPLIPCLLISLNSYTSSLEFKDTVWRREILSVTLRLPMPSAISFNKLEV